MDAYAHAAGVLGESTNGASHTKIIVEGNPGCWGPSRSLRAQSPIIVEPGQTVTQWVRLRYLTQTVVTPAAGTDYLAVSSGMMDLSGSLTVTATMYAQQVKLEFQNTHASQAIHVLELGLRGYPLIGEANDKQEYESTLTPAKVPGKKEFTISGNHFLQTMAQQALVGSRMRDLLQRPRRIYAWRGRCAHGWNGRRRRPRRGARAERGHVVVSLAIRSGPRQYEMC